MLTLGLLTHAVRRTHSSHARCAPLSPIEFQSQPCSTVRPRLTASNRPTARAAPRQEGSGVALGAPSSCQHPPPARIRTLEAARRHVTLPRPRPQSVAISQGSTASARAVGQSEGCMPMPTPISGGLSLMPMPAPISGGLALMPMPAPISGGLSLVPMPAVSHRSRSRASIL